jgi:uncharacterized membrane protein
MAKTATFGVMHVITAFSVTYAMTGSLTIAGVVTFVEPVVNTVMHYFFDKYWDHPRIEKLRADMQGWLRLIMRRSPAAQA